MLLSYGASGPAGEALTPLSGWSEACLQAEEAVGYERHLHLQFVRDLAEVCREQRRCLGVVRRPVAVLERGSHGAFPNGRRSGEYLLGLRAVAHAGAPRSEIGVATVLDGLRCR